VRATFLSQKLINFNFSIFFQFYSDEVSRLCSLYEKKLLVGEETDCFIISMKESVDFDHVFRILTENLSVSTEVTQYILFMKICQIQS
jgi:hypothetical protein